MAFGMFVHWGLYSLLERGEWILHHSRMPEAEYRKLTERFTAENFDARALARLAKRAGMKYITLSARHHDGFSLYDTRGLSTYDAPHSAAGRDLIAEFVEGCRAEGIVPFLYHTTLDWSFGTADCDEATFNEYLDYLHASVEILCREYGPLGGLWFDGNWSREADWKEDRLYGMIRKYQPDCMIINNTGLGHRGVWGHPEIDSTTFEQGLPQPIDRRGLAEVRGGGNVPNPEQPLGRRPGGCQLYLACAGDREPRSLPRGGRQLPAQRGLAGGRRHPQLRSGHPGAGRRLGGDARRRNL
jgi:alpha-L-fucosidase